MSGLPGTHEIVHTLRRPFAGRSSVQGHVRGEVGDGGEDVALAAEDHGPEVVGAVDEGVSGEGVEDEPGAGGDLLLELARGPAGVAGEDPDAGDTVAEAVGVGG